MDVETAREKSVASYNEIGLTFSDFHKIVSVLREEAFVRKNASRYDIYIIRICSMRRIEPRNGEELRDLKYV